MTRCQWLFDPIPAPNPQRQLQAEQHQAQLTKPPGSLGRLETLAIQLSALQDQAKPEIDPARCVVFAADHGITAAGVSAFPQSVTMEMIRNFCHGGAAISVLARHAGASLEVVDVGALQDPAPLPLLISQRVSSGSRDFRYQTAMTPEQQDQAFEVGKQAVERAQAEGCRLLIGGEMGIGNSTSATATLAALLGASPGQLTGPGTGLSPSGVAHKVKVIEAALRTHQHRLMEPLSILGAVGGLEICALTGFYLAAAQQRIPLLVDGFIASVAALAAWKLQPDLLPWLFFAHRSTEPGFQALTFAMSVQPILDLNMRLGEGSGAAVALPILRMACALHREMATFAEAAVSRAHS
ncbi:nicotinate-nucleotide--dimethylbenzimidazole phosphoribosyltransferase [Candidatus Magnetaquicoccus inordinatus]|uniref:nicotinate-nucleotide--dimethylbenzimidazole phosphoribosyltransferase n=1 Tax=Candidatus Magnetaquicoccus inordinatus TaxID=2496818 RepID=UPI00102BA649|nr:nicotinate-nucleotide--dimethylbenzimidazole phosphoribosyltransferase [Candidatus Magnetaquicoccus inordinatus]